MNYHFEGKILAEIPIKRSFWKKLCLTLGIISGLCSLALVIMGSFGNVSFLTGIFVPTYLIISGLHKDTKSSYIPALTEIEFRPGKITVTYPKISEFFQFTSNNIQSFQFSSSLSAIRFRGFPVTESSAQNTGIKMIPVEKVIYLPTESAQDICANAEYYLNIKAEVMDKQI